MGSETRFWVYFHISESRKHRRLTFCAGTKFSVRASKYIYLDFFLLLFAQFYMYNDYVFLILFSTGVIIFVFIFSPFRTSLSLWSLELPGLQGKPKPR